jgi:predicted TIM-barrel fold metal-dependent hydrolase
MSEENRVLTTRIDCHAHYLPDAYRRAGRDAYPEGPDGFPGFPEWSARLALEQMESTGIAAAVLSVSSPGVHFGDDAAACTLARVVNEVGARTVQDYPRRFGLFASLPLPDSDGSLTEIAYAFDELGADGVVLLTNARGTYLGDAALDPVFEELNRRDAVLFMHPTSPFCPACHGSGLDFPRPMLEFMFESTRAVTNMVLSGTLDRYPNIKLIVPHAGAALPVLAERIGSIAGALRIGSGSPNSVIQHLHRLHYDLAGFPVPTLLRALMDIANPQHVLYGSDWPFTPASATRELAAALDTTDLIGPDWRGQIYRDNALRLLPSLSRRLQ